MKITLKQWQELDKLAKDAHRALKALDDCLAEVSLANFHSEPEVKFCTTIQDRLADATFITMSLQLQSEWLGGDSSKGENHGLREPNAVSIIGNIPHLIEGSRGQG